MDAHFLHIVIPLPYFLWHHNQPKALATSEGCNMINTTSISMYRMARSLEEEQSKKHWRRNRAKSTGGEE